jgi:hypothetical protein
MGLVTVEKLLAGKLFLMDANLKSQSYKNNEITGGGVDGI